MVEKPRTGGTAAPAAPRHRPHPGRREDGPISEHAESMPARVESIAELRRLVQTPVEHRNDLTGKLYGSRISIFITRFFLARGWHPNVASALMLVNGLVGAGLLMFGGVWAVVGFFLLETYYLFDCVDGELARYHGLSHLKAAYYDYMAHVAVKSAMFLALGYGLSREVGAMWPFFVALAPTLALLFAKIASDVHHQIFCSKFLLDRDEPAIRRLDEARPAPEPAATPASDEPSRPSRLGVVRELVLNFDFYLVLFFVAALADVFVAMPTGWPSLTMMLFLAYAVALPLNCIDHILSDLFSNRMLDRIAHLRDRVEDRRS